MILLLITFNYKILYKFLPLYGWTIVLLCIVDSCNYFVKSWCAGMRPGHKILIRGEGGVEINRPQ